MRCTRIEPCAQPAKLEVQVLRNRLAKERTRHERSRRAEPWQLRGYQIGGYGQIVVAGAADAADAEAQAGRQYRVTTSGEKIRDQHVEVARPAQ